MLGISDGASRATRWSLRLCAAAVALSALPAPAAAATGPYLVKDINTSGSSSPAELTSLGDNVFFTAKGGGKGRELWLSDGSAAGTRRVKDIRPGSQGSNPRELTVFRDLLFFAADDGSFGEELWVSDGTNAGTQRITDITAGAGSTAIAAPTVVKDRLFFFAGTGAGRLELWKTDGTTGGTTRVKQLFTGAALRASPVPFGGRLYFGLDQCGGGVCASMGLWRSSGTASGTKRFHFVDDATYPEEIATTSNRLYWSDSAGLMVSNGSSSGTSRLLGIEASELTAIDARLFFVTHEELNKKLWQTSGLVANTESLEEFHPDYPLTGLTNVAGRLYYSANHLGLTPNHLWYANDFSSGGPDAVQGCCPDHADPANITNVAGFVLFSAHDRFTCAEGDPCADEELWLSDGTDSGTFRVADIRPGPMSSAPRWLEEHYGQETFSLFFTADDGAHGRELWRYVP